MVFIDKWVNDFQEKLLIWYWKEGRVLPWRTNPTPYHIWVSEIMLQQTQVDTVIPYYNRFLKEVPTVASLANMEDDKLLKLWQGLGYYKRAANLKHAAQIIMEKWNGTLPCDKKQLMSLPGIGEYTAGAILSMAFNMPVPAVDGNVLRIIARLHAMMADLQSGDTKNVIRTIAQEMVSADYPGDFNQGLMDLGANICLSRQVPKCGNCPVQAFCQAKKQGIVSAIPQKNRIRQRKIVEKTVLVMIHEDRLALCKREQEGLLAGLWELPNIEGSLSLEEGQAFLAQYDLEIMDAWQLKGTKHQFTHLEWSMTGYCFKVKAKHDAIDKDRPGWVWVDLPDIDKNYAIPSAFLPFLNMAAVSCTSPKAEER